MWKYRFFFTCSARTFGAKKGPSDGIFQVNRTIQDSFLVFYSYRNAILILISINSSVIYQLKWQSLYINGNCTHPRSESPTQAFLITVLWLYRKFKALEELGHSQETIINEMRSTVLAYDNMCHMDNLIISRSHLPFPYPYIQRNVATDW